MLKSELFELIYKRLDENDVADEDLVWTLIAELSMHFEIEDDVDETVDD